MPFILDMKELLAIHRLAIILSRQAERLMLQCEERVILSIEEFFLVVEGECFGFALKYLLTLN